jgi:hypothetical protein
MARVLEQSTKDEIKRLRKAGLTVMEISKRLLVGHVAVKKYCDEFDREDGEDAPVATPEPRDEAVETKRQFAEAGDTAELKFTTPHVVRTKEDAIRYGEVDTTVWKVVKWECTSNEMVAKNEKLVRSRDDKYKVETVDGVERRRLVESKEKTWKLKTPERHHLWRVHLKLERIMPQPYMDATEALFRRLEDYAPRYEFPAVVEPASPYFMELDLFDVHFANLAWAAECRESDDLRIKEAIFSNAIGDLLSKTSGYPVDEVIFPVGNDLHHIDTLSKTTTGGTPQDCDSRYAKMIEITEGAVIGGIERMLASPKIRRVRVLYVPGNHDMISTLHLCRVLKAWFRHTGRVEVDVTPTSHKYVKEGRCLFGYIHGDKSGNDKLKSLPTIMAVEEPAWWADSICREWKLGHKHTSETFETQSSHEFNGVKIRRLSALTRTNVWHVQEQYIGNIQAAEAYLYDRTDGYQGHFVAKSRT